MIRARTLPLALVLWLAAVPVASAADEERAGDGTAAADVEEEANGWQPAFVFDLMIFDYQAEGRALSAVGQDTANKGRRTVDSYRFGLELMSPEVGIPWLEPRFVFGGGAQVGPRYVVTMAQRGEFERGQPLIDINTAITCNQPFSPRPCPPPWPDPSTFAGQASQVNGVYEGLAWYATLGAEMPMPGLASRMSFRPTVTYLGEKTSAQARLTSATGTGPRYQEHSHITRAQADMHYIGPGLSVDLILSEGRRAKLTVFTGAEFMFNVGDGEIRMAGETTSTQYDQTFIPATNPRDEDHLIPVLVTAPAAPNPVAYTYQAEPFRYMLKFGFRVAWKNAFGGR